MHGINVPKVIKDDTLDHECTYRTVCVIAREFRATEWGHEMSCEKELYTREVKRGGGVGGGELEN